jgi:single-stranded-DNA-specific exonuclease
MSLTLQGRSNKRWRFAAHDTARIVQLERGAGISSIVAQLLIGRGVYDPEAARSFLEARLSGLRDPDLLPGAAEAAERLHAAVQAGRKIVVYGDYDADGMTATAILLGCLKRLGADASYYVPNRLEEGYGLSSEGLRNLARQGASLVVSVDCGIASLREAATARELGLELIVTDHHELADRLPEAAAIVHPRLPGTSYPFGGLCGAGVALKVAWALCQRASQSKRVRPALREFLLQAVGLAAVGTVADVVPLLDENRILVRHGLACLRAQPPAGIAALMEVCGLSQKARLESEDLAFALAPRLNAAGRFGQAQLAVELLTTSAPPRARQLAEYIHELNRSRESLERSILLAAQKQVQEQYDAGHDAALVLAGRGWHAGVIGLVAGRLAEKYHRPVVMLALDPLGAKPAVGSARAPGGFDLYAALKATADYLVAFGGHAAAAGLKIDEGQIDAFRAAFCEVAELGRRQTEAAAELTIDAEGPLCQLTADTLHQIEQLAPFGYGNPRPLLATTGVQLAQPPRRIGHDQRHLALRFVQHQTSLRGVGFGCADWAEELAAAQAPLDIVYRPVLNDYRGRRSVELQLVDWRVSTVRGPG